ncbi:MAG: hypothetical protein FJ108_10280 [Deltaproteobacteria bacterium]|nr:hypothetical protein [Deltaproteobacteria bacterium]
MARELALALVAALLCASRAVADPALPETTLPLHLVGTVVAAQPERSIAVIESAGKASVLRAGDDVGGAQLREIHKDGVVLALSGRVAPSASGRASAAVWAPESGASADSRDEREPMLRRAVPHARARAVSARDARQPGRSASEPASPDALLASLSGQARYAPVQDASGALHGLALLDVRPDSALERIGLRSGDVVVSVAGVKLAQGSRAFDALRALDPSAGGEVLIERQGVPTRIAVPPGAL